MHDPDDSEIIPTDPQVVFSYWQWQADNPKSNAILCRDFEELYPFGRLFGEIAEAKPGTAWKVVSAFQRQLEAYFLERRRFHTLPEEDNEGFALSSYRAHRAAM